jgi:hypothetical protein
MCRVGEGGGVDGLDRFNSRAMCICSCCEIGCFCYFLSRFQLLWNRMLVLFSSLSSVVSLTLKLQTRSVPSEVHGIEKYASLSIARATCDF